MPAVNLNLKCSSASKLSVTSLLGIVGYYKESVVVKGIALPR